MKYLYWLAIIGGTISFIVHVSTFFGVDPLEVSETGVYLLFFGLFIVFPPALMLKPQQDKTKTVPRVFRGLSQGALFLVVACFAYVILNFAIVLTMMDGKTEPREKNGRYYINTKNERNCEITAREYHEYRAQTIRVMSSGAIMFYCVAGSILREKMLN